MIHMMIFTILSIIMAVTCSCSNNSFISGDKCYCNAEADKLNACVKAKSPNWPFIKDPSASKSDCPDPVTDSAGFDSCIKSRSPQKDPNGDKIVSECISSTGAKSTDGSSSSPVDSASTSIRTDSGKQSSANSISNSFLALFLIAMSI